MAVKPTGIDMEQNYVTVTLGKVVFATIVFNVV